MAGDQPSESGTDKRQWCSRVTLVLAIPVWTEQNEAQVCICQVQ